MSMLLCIELLCIVLAALTVAAVLFIRRRRRVTAPCCRACGYDVRGLPSSICPECGSDLESVGILRPGQSRPMTPAQRCLLWTVLMLLAAPAGIDVAMTFGPQGRYETLGGELVPASGAYSKVFICCDGSGIADPVPVDQIKCMIYPPNKIIVILEIDARTLGFTYPDMKWRPVRRTSGFDREAILAAMRTGAVDTTRADVQREAAELTQIILGIADGTRHIVTPTNFSGSESLRQYVTLYRSGWSAAGGGVLLLMLWLAGCGWIRNCHQRDNSP